MIYSVGYVNTTKFNSDIYYCGYSPKHDAVIFLSPHMLSNYTKFRIHTEQVSFIIERYFNQDINDEILKTFSKTITPPPSTRLPDREINKVTKSIQCRINLKLRLKDNLKHFKIGKEYSLYCMNSTTKKFISKIVFIEYNNETLLFEYANNDLLFLDNKHNIKYSILIETEPEQTYYDVDVYCQLCSEHDESWGFPKDMQPVSATLNTKWTYNEILQDILYQRDVKLKNTIPRPSTGDVDNEYAPRFTIKDIDKIFDEERRNHGSNPLDSINRMYRKLLALKEKGI